MRITSLRTHLSGRAYITGWRRAIAAGAGLVIAVGLATGITQLAGASPQPTISQVKAKISALNSQFLQAVQQYDQASSQLTAAKARLSQVNKQMASATANYQASRKEFVQIADASYMDSGQTSLAGLLTSNDPSKVLGAASILAQLSGARNAQAQAFFASARQLTSVQQTQQHTETGIQQLATSRSNTKNHIQHLIKQQQTILANLTAQQRAAVAAATGPGGTSGSSSSSSSSGGSGSGSTPVYSGTTAQKAVEYEKGAIGCIYTYGATGPCSTGYDCSGLVVAAYAAAGLSGLPRTTYSMWSAFPAISKSELQPGDLIFYDGEGHVAMYVGGGMIIDAPHTGAVVEEISMNESWYAANTDGYRRVP